MKSPKRPYVRHTAALISGLILAVTLPAACGSDSKSGKSGADGGGNGGNGADAAQGANGGSTALTQIDAVLKDPTTGFTPTAAALDLALTYFTTGAGASLTGDKYVLLATDGGPNCNSSLTPACGYSTCTVNLDNQCGADGRTTNCCAVSIVGSTVLCLDAAATTAKITALRTAGVKPVAVGIPG